MSEFFVKNKKGEFIPVKIDKIIGKEDLDNNLVIVRVGTDDYPADMKSLELIQESFSQADILDEVDTSILITSFQIDIDTASLNEIEEKHIYIQIKSGEDISMLDEQSRRLYKELRKKTKGTVLLPSPIKIRDYDQVKETLKRCQIRRKRMRNKHLT